MKKLIIMTLIISCTKVINNLDIFNKNINKEKVFKLIKNGADVN